MAGHAALHRLGTCDRGISGAYGGWWPVRPGQALPGRPSTINTGIGPLAGPPVTVVAMVSDRRGRIRHAYGHAGGRGDRWILAGIGAGAGPLWAGPAYITKRPVRRTCPTASVTGMRDPDPSRCWTLLTRPGSRYVRCGPFPNGRAGGFSLAGWLGRSAARADVIVGFRSGGTAYTGGWRL